MTPNRPSNQPSRRQQRSLPRLRNFFDTTETHKRRRVGSLVVLALACAGAALVMGA